MLSADSRCCGMKLSSGALSAFKKISAEYIEKGFPERHIIAWGANSKEEVMAHSELQAPASWKATTCSGGG